MIGIYKFTNKITNESYIGQSINLESRYKTHKKQHNNKNHPSYNTKFYIALRKYGFDNFTYEILEQNNNLTREKLNDLEKYYIKKYDTYRNGYNMNQGGNYTSGPKELSEKQVEKIKKAIFNSDILLTTLAEEYKVSVSTISMINSGTIWKHIGNYKFYPLRVQDRVKISQGSNNGRAKVSDEIVMKIRNDYVKMSLSDICLKYAYLDLSFSEMKKIVYGVRFTHLPIYKKRQKQWIS